MPKHTLQGALERCELSAADAAYASVRLERAVERYELAIAREDEERSRGAPTVAKELNAFHRSLSRSPAPSVAAERIAQLSAEAKIFTQMQLQRQATSASSFEHLNLSDPSDVAALASAAGAARSWLGAKPGTEHSFALRDLVKSVSAIYGDITGKAPGITSSQTTSGPDYVTPFEEVLSATLAEAGIVRSPEAVRSLYRALERGKPKK